MKQIALIVMLSAVGFAVVLAVFIADRLTAEEVALLAGVVCGIGVAVPLGVMAGAAWPVGGGTNNRRRSCPRFTSPSHRNRPSWGCRPSTRVCRNPRRPRPKSSTSLARMPLMPINKAG